MVTQQWGTWFIIDGATSGMIKRRHDVTFPLLTEHREKDRVHFSTGFIQKKTLSIPASFFIRKTDEISRTLHLMHDGICFDENLP
jgi:chorismate synthase